MTIALRLTRRLARQDAAQRFDIASFVDIEVTRRGEFSRQPFELRLDPLALLVAQNPFEQRHGAAQSAQADAHLMHAFGVRPSHYGFVGCDVAAILPTRLLVHCSTRTQNAAV